MPGFCIAARADERHLAISRKCFYSRSQLLHIGIGIICFHVEKRQTEAFSTESPITRDSIL